MDVVDKRLKTIAVSYSSSSHRYGEQITQAGSITGTTYSATGTVLTISYANGVTTTYGYSPTRDWLNTLHYGQRINRYSPKGHGSRLGIFGSEVQYAQADVWIEEGIGLGEYAVGAAGAFATWMLYNDAPPDPAAATKQGKGVITQGKTPNGYEIDNRGEGRSGTGALGEAATASGVQVGTTADGKPTVVFPDGSRATGMSGIMRRWRASSPRSRLSALLARSTGPAMRQGRTCSTTSSDSTTPEADTRRSAILVPWSSKPQLC